MRVADRVSGYSRRRKFKLFLDTVRPVPETSVLDVGYTDVEYHETDNFLEKNYPYRRMITALGTETPTLFHERYPEIPVVVYDGRRFPFRDQAFDVCWSSAVLEHVGSRGNQIAFLREIKRVSKLAFVTTPNRYFPIESHTHTPFLHWLPKSIFDRYLKIVRHEWWIGDHLNLLSIGALRQILAEAGIEEYKIIRNRVAALTLDFAIIF